MAKQKTPSAILVIRERTTTKLPPMQLGSFHKLFEPDEYEGKKKLKTRLHINTAGLAALEKTLQAKCIDAHFDEMKETVDGWLADLPAGKKPTFATIVATKDECQTPTEWLEDKLKDPHEKDKVQLPSILLSVDYYLPLKKGQDESEREPREIKFWNAKGQPIENAPKRLAKMTSGTWVIPIVHANLFLSKQLGKEPRCQLQLVGFQIHTLVEFGRNEAPPSAADEDEMKRIMGADYHAADDIENLTGGLEGAEPDGDEEDPF